MVFRRIKYIIVLALICGIVIPSFAQKGTLNKAMKQGKMANGYYHAVFKHTAYSKKRLAKFAERQGYYLTNMTEEKVLQFGDCSSAVVSLDFMPLNEVKDKYKNAIDAAIKQTGVKYSDINLERKIIAGSANTEGDIVTIQDYNTFELTTENIEKDWKKHVRAGLSCGFFCIDFTSGNPNTYRYVSFETVNSRLAKQFNLKNIASSSGSGYVNMNENGFENVNDIIWSGNCVDGKINDYGLGYTMTTGKIIKNSVFRIPEPTIYYTIEGTIINCFVGNYKNGKPTGECKYYSFNIKDLLEDKAFDSPTSIKIYPFNEGLARCDIPGYTNYIDNNYKIKLRGVNSIKYLECNVYGNSVVKDFENGLLTLSSALSSDLHEKNRIEFYVDKNGKFVSLTKNGEALVDSIIDETVKQYNNYISKVFNPTDIVKPTGTLKNRFNYDLSSFPAKVYKNIITESICEQAVANYKKRNAKNFDKSDLAAKVVQLIKHIAYLENFDKDKYKNDFIKGLEHYGYENLPERHGDSYFTEGWFDYHKKKITDDLKEIGNSKQKPGNFQQVEKAINKYCDEYIKWWASIYSEAVKLVNERKAEIKQEKCSKCKIDEITFPSGDKLNGKIVFVNGDFYSWRFVYTDRKRTEIDYIEVYGEYIVYKTYRSVDEMKTGLINQCKKEWCK